MSFKKYSDEEIKILREGGKRLAIIIEELGSFLKVGLPVSEIENKSLELIEKYESEPATVGYQPTGAPFPFPSSVCTSINNEIAHGISKDREYKLKEGDVVSLDIVIKYRGLYVDICRTFGVGKVSDKDRKLIEVSRMVTNEAIKMAKIGNTTDDIGRVSELTAKKYGFRTIKELGGHGVGRKIHDKPFIPSFGNSGYSDKIEEGMVLAIEPIVSAGT